ncbi:MAG TPA: DUF4908 domain-containing protein [Caulobacteraceae bacterium]|nr:DUF4908 domain-containing protein [Caulobacteraceae bacterium]
MTPAVALAGSMSFHSAVASRHVGERSDPPVISRWQTDEGGVFVLDLSSPKPLLRFEDSNEIWVLQPSPGPRGDVIYRNDLGEEMLRATRLGGMTVFTVSRPEGSAAALDGASAPLRIGALAPQAAWRRIYQATIRASRAASHQVAFDPDPQAESANASLYADAAMVVSEALTDMSDRPANRGLLARIDDVQIVPGPRPNVTLSRAGVLTITVVPAQGAPAGRPSSRRIEKAIGAK